MATQKTDAQPTQQELAQRGYRLPKAMFDAKHPADDETGVEVREVIHDDRRFANADEQFAAGSTIPEALPTGAKNAGGPTENKAADTSRKASK